MRWMINNNNAGWTERCMKKRSYKNENKSVNGTSGGGKSTNTNTDQMKEVGEKFILEADYVGDSIDDFARRLCGRYPYVLIDDLSCASRVLPAPQYLKVSESPDWSVRKDENQLSRNNQIEFLLRLQNTENIPQPVKIEMLDLGLNLYQHLPREIRQKAPFASCIADLYLPWTDWHHYLCQVCPNQNLVERMKRSRTLHESTRITTYGSAERPLRRTYEEGPVLRRDSQQGIDIGELIRKKYVVGIKGGPGVSVDAYRAVVESWTQEIIHFLEQGGEGPVRIVLEEYDMTGTCATPQLRAMKTLRKRGFSITLISTTPAEDDYTRLIIDNECARQDVYSSRSWDVAQLQARKLTALLDPHKIQDYTERALPDGYEKIETSGYSINPEGEITQNFRESFRPVHRSVFDPHYQSLGDQQTLLAAEIQNDLDVGERFVNDNGECYREYVPLPKERVPWAGVMEERVARWIEKMRQSDFYITPPKEEIKAPCIRIPLKEKKSRSRGSKHTHRHIGLSKSSESSRVTKQRKGVRHAGNGKDSSGTSAD
jgi:hypothetical protein